MTVQQDHPLAQRVLRLLNTEEGWAMTHPKDQRLVHHDNDEWLSLQLSPDFPCFVMHTKHQLILILMPERRRWWNRVLGRDVWEYDRRDQFFQAFHRMREAIRTHMLDATKARVLRASIPSFRHSK